MGFIGEFLILLELIISNSILAELVRLLLHGHLLQAGDGEGKVVVVQDAREEGLSKPSPEQNNQH